MRLSETNLDPALQTAIRRGLTCDITTTGRVSGQPRRIEIWYFLVDDQMYISGTPGPRDWYANVLNDPAMIFHVKQGASADLPARAVPITDPTARRTLMTAIIQQNSYFNIAEIDAWVADSPLIRVDIKVLLPASAQ